MKQAFCHAYSVDDLRGLSVRQPWAWGICAGLKRTENRTWTTDRRGTIAIHASTSPQVVNAIRKDSGCDAMHRDSFTFGAIIGLAEIVDVASYGHKHEDDLAEAARLDPDNPTVVDVQERLRINCENSRMPLAHVSAIIVHRLP